MKYGDLLTGSQPGQFYSPNPIPLEHLTMSGDIFVCHNYRSAPDIWRVEAGCS